MTRVTDRLPAGTLESQRLFEALCEALGYAELHDVLHRRLPDRLHRAEVSQEDALARGPDALDRVQRRSQRLARPDLSMVGDGEAMRLVADALDQEHAWRVALLDDWLHASRCEDLLALLGKRKRRNVSEAGRLEHLERGAELAATSVDENEVRPAGERTVAHHVGVFSALRGLETLEPPPQDLLQHREVVWARHELDLEVTVMVVAWPSVLEHHHRSDRRIALDVRDVVTLDSLRRCFQVESFGERGQHRLGSAAVVIRLYTQLLELLGGGIGQLRHERPFASALRHLDGH